MVRTLLGLALLAGGASHAASLTAQLDRSASALGEPLSLAIQASGLDLDALDLGPLEERFEIFARTRSQGADSETLVLTLYPRAAGVLPVPPLQLDARRTPSLPLAVSDGSEDVPRVIARWTLEPATPRVNQPARLTLDLCDDGSLQWQRPALPAHAGRVLRALGEDEGAGEGCTRHRFHWALLATGEGASQLGVTMLDASRFGQRLRFPGPSLRFEAAALPAWLPAHAPPVEPRVKAAPLPARWPLDRPLSWRFEVEGAYSADGLKTLLALQVRETPALGVYPPLVEAVAPDDRNSPLSRYAVTVFLHPRERGELKLPTLNLPWYDPQRGRMAGAVVTGRTLTVFDPRWQLAGRMAAVVAGLLLLAAIAWQLRRMARWRLARWRGLRAIREARDGVELAHAVRTFSLADRPPAPSLGAWKQRLQQEAEADDVAGAVHLLERQRFGAAPVTTDAVRQAFLQRLGRACPKRPFPGIAAARIKARLQRP